MITAQPRKLVVLGMMAKRPVPGIIWQTAHYLEGFKRLGYEVYYVEAHGAAPLSFIHHPNQDGSQESAAFIQAVMRRFDLGDRWCFQALHADGACYGMSEGQLGRLYRSAEIIVNLSGATLPRSEHVATDRLVYLETDPVAPQIEVYDQNQQTIDFLAQHRAWFTYGENYGRPDCKLPTSERFAFHPTRQPVVLDYWRSPETGGAAFTTIASWNQSGRELWFEGELYHWSKHLEFLKFVDLPRRTDQPFELALNRHAADKCLLESNGWRVRDALAFATDPDAYRAYIAGSRGEFTVAKDQNIRLRTGWFSDRSATYLAAGRPVITQDTAFGHVLPTGCGLFAFTTMDDILAALDSINADYPAHCRAAREIAQAYFSYDVVLPRLLEQIGL
jgi:hypothetical protein